MSSGEIVVFGAGAAGCAAALAASRAGTTVYLCEASSQPGGTVAHSLIHTIGGLFDSTGELLHDGLIAEFVDALTHEDNSVRPRQIGRTWVLNVCPDIYYRVLCRWLVNERRITLVTQCRTVQLSVANGIVREVKLAWPGHERRFRPQAVIDATGTAEIVRRLDRALVQGTGPTAAGGLVLRLRGAARGALQFPGRVAVVKALRNAVTDGELPPECAHAWLDSGAYEDEVYLKLFVPLPADWKSRQAEIVSAASHSGEAVVEFLKHRAEFSQVHIDRIGSLGVREGGRIRGEYCLTADDVRQGRKFDDVACRCAWPIEFWDPQHGISLEYQPPGSCYEIPFRALKVDGFENVWAVGKCLSADPYAQASARIAGCCWAMGQAVGQLVGEGILA